MASLESTPIDVGEQYVALLRQHAPDMLGGKILKKLQRQDRVGGGLPAVYPKVAGELGGPKIKLNPNTLRYVWIFAQLRMNFGTVAGQQNKGWAAGWKVCEIGGWGPSSSPAISLASPSSPLLAVPCRFWGTCLVVSAR